MVFPNHVFLCGKSMRMLWQQRTLGDESEATQFFCPRRWMSNLVPSTSWERGWMNFIVVVGTTFQRLSFRIFLHFNLHMLEKSKITSYIKDCPRSILCQGVIHSVLKMGLEVGHSRAIDIGNKYKSNTEVKALLILTEFSSS